MWIFLPHHTDKTRRPATPRHRTLIARGTEDGTADPALDPHEAQFTPWVDGTRPRRSRTHPAPDTQACPRRQEGRRGSRRTGRAPREGDRRPGEGREGNNSI